MKTRHLELPSQRSIEEKRHEKPLKEKIHNMGIPEGEDKEKETKHLKARSEIPKLEGDSHTDLAEAQRTQIGSNMSRVTPCQTVKCQSKKKS